MRKVWMGAAAFALWLGTAVVGLAAILAVMEMAVRIYAAFWGDYGFYGRDYWGGVTLRNLLIFPLGVAWLAMVIGGGEYHLKKFGQPDSWRLFARTIAAEVAIFVLAYFI